MTETQRKQLELVKHGFANGKSPVIQRFFFAEGVEIEQKMRQRVGLRLTNLEYLNDGDLSIDN